MNFTEHLRSIQRKRNSLLCVGLDTDQARVPERLQSAGNPVYEFNKRIIDATRDLVCAYKLNLAFCEATGVQVWQTIHQTLDYIGKDIITIADGKRGDIGNSAELYARTLLDDYQFQSTTVNPYMGFDSVEPFSLHAERGVFVLALTSNPGAKDFQYLPVKGRPLYEHVIARVKKWNTRHNFGLVVGATRPRELLRARTLVRDMPILIPGIGAQGGDLKLAVRYGCDRSGDLAIINVSRAVLYASAGDNFAAAARSSALALRDEINTYRDKFFS